MKLFFVCSAFVAASLFTYQVSAQTQVAAATTSKAKTSKKSSANENLYLDVHHMGAGKVTAKDVAAAHQKDLAVEKKYGANFIKYWVDETKGDVYCLVSAPNPEALRNTHAEAHGLMPDDIYQVTDGGEAKAKGKNDYYLDLHEFGPGKVSAKDVAGAHQKDLAVQGKYGVNLINYWVDEKKGVVMCLAQAPDSNALINTHKEAHGLVPVQVEKVVQGK